LSDKKPTESRIEEEEGVAMEIVKEKIECALAMTVIKQKKGYARVQ